MDLSLTETKIGNKFDDMLASITGPPEAGVQVQCPAEADPIDDGGRRHAQFVCFHKDAVTLAKLSMGIIAQTLAIILVSPIPNFTSSAKILLSSAAVLAAGAYVFCICAIMMSISKPLVAGSMGVAGSTMAGLSFLSIMASFLPYYPRWVIVLPSLLLLSVFVTSFFEK